MNIKYFITPYCSACHSIEPRVRLLAEKYKIPFETIDLTTDEHLKGEYLLFTVPAILFFDDTKEVKRFAGNFGLLEIEKFIERIY